MIRKDFFEGGFPISHKSPVMCMGKLGGADVISSAKPSITLCYNRFDLKRAIEQDINPRCDPCLCLGIWPGKKTTDGFLLNPDAYTKYAPPEEHKDIDSAESITVILHLDNSLNKLLYIPGSFAENQTPVMSQDKGLYEYIKAAGLKFSSIIEQGPKNE